MGRFSVPLLQIFYVCGSYCQTLDSMRSELFLKLYDFKNQIDFCFDFAVFSILFVKKIIIFLSQKIVVKVVFCS